MKSETDFTSEELETIERVKKWQNMDDFKTIK